MAETKITKKPDTKVTSLKVKRDNLKFSGSWKVPTHATESKSKARATKVRVVWTTYYRSQKSKRAGKRTSRDNVFGDPKKDDDALTATRSRWYPNGKSKNAIEGIALTVTLGNEKGWGDPVTVTYSMARPDEPSMTDPKMDSSTGTVSCDVTPSSDSGKREVYDTAWEIEVSDKNGKNFKSRKKGSWDGSAKRTLSYDVTDFRELTLQQVVYVRFSAWCRGLGGRSDAKVKTYPVGYVPAVTFGGGGKDDKLRYKLTGTTNRDRIIFYLEHNNKTSPYTGKKVKDGSAKKAQTIQLQILKNTDVASEDAADSAGGWEDVSGQSSTDDNETTALIDYVENARPDRGKHVYYRVAADRDGLKTYSKPCEIVELFRSEIDAAGAVCQITAVEPGGDGTSAYATVTWSTTDEMAGTELSWSDDREAWISTSGPDTATFDDGGANAGSMRAKVVDLASGAVVYIRARRYATVDGATRYGPYCETATCLVATQPAQVALTAPAWVASGSGARLTWTFGGGGEQTEWQVLNGSGGIVLNGSGPQGSVVVPAETLAACASGGAAALSVAVSTGGALVTSNQVQVGIADAPSLSVSTSQISAQPAELAFSGASADGCSLHVDLIAEGAAGDGPGGAWYQPEGLSVLSADFDPDWSAGAMTVQMPYSDSLRDGCSYSVRVTATDAATGLSGTATGELAVAYAHQAAAPSDASTVVYSHDPGTGERSCAITPVAPDGIADGDTCDIWRVSPTGNDLVAEGVAFGGTYVDPYAPFSAPRRGASADPATGADMDPSGLPATEADTRYRLVTRTADGDLDWTDVAYSAPCEAMRVDCPVAALELPFDPKASVQADKGTEVRAYRDGSRDGFWPSSAEMSGTLSASLPRLTDPVQAEYVMAIASYQGACMVRLPDGSAFAADLQLSGYEHDEDGALTAVEFDYTRLTTPDIYKVSLRGDADVWAEEGA